MSCSSEAAWACTDKGRILIRLGSLCPSSTRKLPQAWIPISTENADYDTGSLLFDKVRSSFILCMLLFNRLCRGLKSYNSILILFQIIVLSWKMTLMFLDQMWVVWYWFTFVFEKVRHLFICACFYSTSSVVASNLATQSLFYLKSLYHLDTWN